MILSKLTNNEIKGIKAVALDNILVAFKTNQPYLFIKAMDTLTSADIITYSDVKTLYNAFDIIFNKKEK